MKALATQIVLQYCNNRTCFFASDNIASYVGVVISIFFFFCVRLCKNEVMLFRHYLKATTEESPKSKIYKAKSLKVYNIY